MIHHKPVINLTFSIIFFIVGTTSISAASFDCDTENNLNQTEILICNSEVVSMLDEVLMIQYESAKNVVNQVDLKRDQVGWIRQRQRTCHTEDCLVREYLSRIHTLRFWNNEIEVTDERIGHYERIHPVQVYNSDRQEWVSSGNAVDTLSLKQIADQDEVSVSVHTTTTNWHTCTLEGLGRVEGGIILVDRDMDGSPLPKSCELHIKFYEGKIELVDEGLSCKRYHCGLRAGFNGQTFTRFEFKHE